MHYTQQKGIKGVTIEDIYIGNGASELIVMAMNALLDAGDEVLVPAPDYPLWTAAVACRAASRCITCATSQAGWLPDIDDMRAKITPTRARSWSSTRTTRPARCIRTRPCCESSNSPASTT